MAQLTNSTRTTPRPYRSRKGDYTIWSFDPSTAVSTAAIKYGDVVQFDVNVACGKIVKSSTMANQPNVISTAILGIAVSESTAAGSSATSEKIQVVLADSQTEFLWPTKQAGADHGSSLVGLRKAIGYDSTLSMFYLDMGNSTAGDATLIITECIEPGTTNGQYVAKFNSTNVARFVASGL
jgi:hypothetical protein